MTGASVRWPLVGRDVELRVVSDAVLNTTTDVVLLSGPAGVGKTRLADAVFTGHVDLGRPGGWAAAGPSLAAVPLGALAHLLPVDALDVAAGAGGLRLFAAVRVAFAASTGAPFLLVVDDVSHLDEASLSLLAQLVNARAITVIGTHRAGTPVPVGFEALAGTDRAVRVDLGLLGQADTGVLLERVLDGDVDGSTQRAFWELSQGNLLYLRELVDGALSSGALRERHGFWTLDAELSGTPRLVDLVMERIGRLSPAGRSLAELTAMCAPVELGLLDHGGAGHAAVELERAGLATVVVHAGRPSLTISHPLYAEIVIARTPEAERRRILIEHVRQVEDRGSTAATELMRLAVWRLDAGEIADRDVLVRGARAARAANDFTTTLRLADAARQSGAGDDVAGLLGDALYELGAFERAGQLLIGALERATDEVTIVGLAVQLRDVEFWGLNHPEVAIGVLQSARSRLTIPALQDALRAAESMTLAFADRPAEALALLAEIGLMVAPISTVAGVAKAAALARVGRTGDAIDVARRSRAEQLALADPTEYGHPSLHLITESFALTEAGRFTDAVDIGHQAYSEALDAALPLSIAWAALNIASAELQRGRLLVARRWANEALTLSERASLVNGQRLALTIALAADGQRRQLAELEDWLERLALLPPDGGFLRELEAVGMAWALHALGRFGEARQALDEGLERATAAGLVGSEAYLRQEAARLGWFEGWRRVDALVDASDSAIVRARAEHVQGLLQRDGATLLRAGAALEASGADLAAAEAFAAATRAFADDGDLRSASSARRASDALMDRCDGASTPGLDRRPDLVEPLTVREHEVASLAAGGLPNREIADRLFLSKRTVDNHLQRIYTKLGVAGRADLPDVLGRTVSRSPESTNPA